MPGLVDEQHQVFISSQMTRETLREERMAVRQIIIERFAHFRPWDWEHNGCAGEKTPMEQCLEEVQRSRALVLIVSQTLTDHTRMEYEKAVEVGITSYIFFKQGRQRGPAYEFRESLTTEGSSSWLVYQNLQELRSAVLRSLTSRCYQADLAYQPSIGTRAEVVA